jgi:hypothetical protein
MHLSERNIGHVLKMETLLAEHHLVRTKEIIIVLLMKSCKQLSFNVS